MQEFVVKKSDWHWKLSHLYRKLVLSGNSAPKDFCQYWRWVLYSAIVAVTLFVGAISALVSIVTIILALFINPMFILMLAAVMVVVAGISLFITYLIMVLVDYYISKKGKHRKFKKNENDVGFFATKYLAFKNKFCPQIKIEA